MKISQMQIEEILDEVVELKIRKHPENEGDYIVIAVASDGESLKIVDRDSGPDIGELVNELHSRL